MAADTSTPVTACDLPSRLLRRRDVAELAGLCLRTIERMDLEGQGPRQTRIGRSVRYHPADVAEWLRARRRSTSDPGQAANA